MSLLLETLHQLQSRSPAARPLLPLADDTPAKPELPSLAPPVRTETHMAESLGGALAEIEQWAEYQSATILPSAENVNERSIIGVVAPNAASEIALPRELPSPRMRQLAARLTEHVALERFCVLVAELSGSHTTPGIGGKETGESLAVKLAGSLAAAARGAGFPTCQNSAGDVLLIQLSAECRRPARSDCARPHDSRAAGAARSAGLSDLLVPGFERSLLICETSEPGMHRLQCRLTKGDMTANGNATFKRAISLLRADFRAIVIDAGSLNADCFAGLAAACDTTLLAVPLGVDARTARKSLARLHRSHAPRVACVAIAG